MTTGYLAFLPPNFSNPLTPRQWRDLRAKLAEAFPPTAVEDVKKVSASWHRWALRGFSSQGKTDSLLPSIYNAVRLYSDYGSIHLVPAGMKLTNDGGAIRFAANAQGANVLRHIFMSMSHNLGNNMPPLETTTIELGYERGDMNLFSLSWTFENPENVRVSQRHFNLLLAVACSSIRVAENEIRNAKREKNSAEFALAPFATQTITTKKHEGNSFLPEME